MYRQGHRSRRVVHKISETKLHTLGHTQFSSAPGLDPAPCRGQRAGGVYITRSASATAGRWYSSAPHRPHQSRLAKKPAGLGRTAGTQWRIVTIEFAAHGNSRPSGATRLRERPCNPPRLSGTTGVGGHLPWLPTSQGRRWTDAQARPGARAGWRLGVGGGNLAGHVGAGGGHSCPLGLPEDPPAGFRCARPRRRTAGASRRHVAHTSAAGARRPDRSRTPAGGQAGPDQGRPQAARAAGPHGFGPDRRERDTGEGIRVLGRGGRDSAADLESRRRHHLAPHPCAATEAC